MKLISSIKIIIIIVHALKVTMLNGLLQRSSALELVLVSDVPLPEGFGNKPSLDLPLIVGRRAPIAAACFLLTPGAGSIGFVILEFFMVCSLTMRKMRLWWVATPQPGLNNGR